MSLFMIQAQEDEPHYFVVNEARKQSLHLAIDMCAKGQYLI